LVVRVSDDSKGEAKFLLFNNIAERLIRRPAFELVQEAAQVFPSFFNLGGIKKNSFLYIL